jgi:hypothetical protein
MLDKMFQEIKHNIKAKIRGCQQWLWNSFILKDKIRKNYYSTNKKVSAFSIMRLMSFISYYLMFDSYSL